MSVLLVNSLVLVSTNLETDGKMRALYHYIGLGTWQDAAWYRSLTDPNTIEDIEVFINEHRQHHPEVPDEQGEASHMQLEELSTLGEENITEGQMKMMVSLVTNLLMLWT